MLYFHGFEFFPYLPRLLGLQIAEPVDTKLLHNRHLTRIAPEGSNLGSESHSSGPKWSGYDSETLFTMTKPCKIMEILENYENSEKP